MIASPHSGQRALAMLHSSESPPLSTILMILLQDLVEVDSDIILILDDYHVISDHAIHESMLFLLDHLPANLHLVLATRTDPELPLSRLRVRGQLIEIRDRDLRFTQEEAANFLTQRMGLPLSEGDVATLHQRTVGSRVCSWQRSPYERGEISPLLSKTLLAAIAFCSTMCSKKFLRSCRSRSSSFCSRHQSWRG